MSAPLPIFHTDNKDLMLLQTKWAGVLNPLLRQPLSSGILLKDLKLTVGDNSIDHLLQRTPQGYLVTGMHGAFTQIYDKPSQTPKLTLVLNSSVATTIDLVVF